MALPRVYLIGTGGTISFVAQSRTDYVDYTYNTRNLTIEEMLARIPEAAALAEVRPEQLVNVASTDVGPEEWLALANRVNTIFRTDPLAAGVAITHGTASLEETAYFLNLTVKSDKPVVVTGAMRPPSSISTDADLNLLDAIRVAASPAACGMGTLVVMNNEIQAARDVAKSDALRVQTMTSRALGLLGYADSDGGVAFFRAPIRKHTRETDFVVDSIKALPRVDIVPAYAGGDGLVIRALVDAGVAGIVAAGMGSGSGPTKFLQALDDAVRRGVKVVVATYSPDGRVLMKKRFVDGGYIVADNLSPKKARVLLMLGLAQGGDANRIQQWVWRY